MKKTRIYWPIGITKEMPGRTGSGELIGQSVFDYLSNIASEGTEISIGWMNRTTTLLSSNFLGMINDAQVITDILHAQENGFDAAVIGCHWDPGLYPAREAASIPVIGPLEASTMIAQTLGRKFAVLTVHDGYIPMIERSLRIYGCESRAINRNPVRKFGMTYENLLSALSGEDDLFLKEFTKVAMGCIEDGADVIIAGGQLFGPIFKKHNYTSIPGTGVPIVEVSSCGLKMAEVMVNLRRTVGLKKSEDSKSPFRTPPADVLSQAINVFGF